jgi:hypothetical protein
VSHHILEERRRGLEEAFFAKHNRELLQRLREKAASETAIEDLKAASGVDDEALLGELVELGISSETLAALGLVPLVQVAWADGRMDAAESAAILEGAAAVGAEPGSPSYALLEGWLAEEPGSEMLSAWSQYVAGLGAVCSKGSMDALKAVTLRRAERVAEAAGGVLGVHRVSGSEREVLSQIAEAFAGT